MSSSSDVAGTKALVAAANKKGGQLTSAEAASVLSGVNRSSVNTTNNQSSISKDSKQNTGNKMLSDLYLSAYAPVTDMSQWYRDTQASQGYKPTADQVSAATQSYKEYVAGKTNPNSGTVWNQYGEVIGNTGTGKGGYTDFSWQGANAYVDPNRTWNAGARDNPDYQRHLTGTPLSGTYLDYNTNQWGQAPEAYRTGKANSPGFVNYSMLPEIAQRRIDNWAEQGVEHLWDVPSLVELWQGQYQDLGEIPSMINQNRNEFTYGTQPGAFNYEPGTLYGDAYTTPAPEGMKFSQAKRSMNALTPTALNDATIMQTDKELPPLTPARPETPTTMTSSPPPPPASSPPPPPASSVTVNRPPDPAFYQDTGVMLDAEMELRQYYGAEAYDALPDWKKQAVLESYIKLGGGR